MRALLLVTALVIIATGVMADKCTYQPTFTQPQQQEQDEQKPADQEQPQQ